MRAPGLFATLPRSFDTAATFSARTSDVAARPPLVSCCDCSAAMTSFSKLDRTQSARNAGSGIMSRQATAQIHIVP